MTSTPLNILQKLMRRWDAVHPYNAAQVMKLTGTPDAQAWRSAWRSTLAQTGLGAVAIKKDRYEFVALNGHLANYDVRFPQVGLCEHISVELNRPFDDSHEPPFRPFLITIDGAFYAGLIYQHWLADSASIRMLMREWFVRVYDPSAARVLPMDRADHGYWKTLGHHHRAWSVPRSLTRMANRHLAMRRVQKIDSTALDDHATRFELIATPEGLIDRIKAFSKSQGVKVNDIFLAALVQACAEHVPLQARKKRSHVAVGSVVDLRPWCRETIAHSFGLFLGFTNVICQPNDLQSFDQILRSVAQQTRVQKTTGVAPASLMWMAGAFYVGKLSKPDDLYHFYRKELPLAGGISNVDLSREWMSNYHPAPLLDYIRISPTGPMVPLAITTTTLGQRFHVGMTYRTGLLPKDRAGSIVDAFINRLCSL